eukprot:CAMPEP_0183358776 /NCGR_PEP_ID=MMETSP0164_2-20130417/50281_1 /TAXON_ID=221442 /ORGANISM="Coccolithus pelagicus ssp braarudi, Strain PLY182g" /LENGTH=564 /DNA_ID=CAMNT_0025532731 /DNA_START=22 /DNA_END=1719 /DNA_ORIENTATION=+
MKRSATYPSCHNSVAAVMPEHEYGEPVNFNMFGVGVPIGGVLLKSSNFQDVQSSKDGDVASSPTAPSPTLIPDGHPSHQTSALNWVRTCGSTGELLMVPGAGPARCHPSEIPATTRARSTSCIPSSTASHEIPIPSCVRHQGNQIYAAVDGGLYRFQDGGSAYVSHVELPSGPEEMRQKFQRTGPYMNAEGNLPSFAGMLPTATPHMILPGTGSTATQCGRGCMDGVSSLPAAMAQSWVDPGTYGTGLVQEASTALYSAAPFAPLLLQQPRVAAPLLLQQPSVEASPKRSAWFRPQNAYLAAPANGIAVDGVQPLIPQIQTDPQTHPTVVQMPGTGTLPMSNPSPAVPTGLSMASMFPMHEVRAYKETATRANFEYLQHSHKRVSLVCCVPKGHVHPAPTSSDAQPTLKEILSCAQDTTLLVCQRGRMLETGRMLTCGKAAFSILTNGDPSIPTQNVLEAPADRVHCFFFSERLIGGSLPRQSTNGWVGFRLGGGGYLIGCAQNMSTEIGIRKQSGSRLDSRPADRAAGGAKQSQPALPLTVTIYDLVKIKSGAILTPREVSAE